MKRIDIKTYGKYYVMRVYKTFRFLDFALLFFYPLFLFLFEKTMIELMAIGFYVFAVLEYINYFYIRLSYSVFEFAKRIVKLNFVNSRIAKEIKNLNKGAQP